MKLKRIFAALTAAVMMLTALPSFAEESAENETEVLATSDIVLSTEYVAFDQIAEFVSEYYLDSDLSKEDIKLMAVSGFLEDNFEVFVELMKSMLTSLDPYSDFFTAEEYRNYLNDINKTFYGIGIYMEKNGDYTEISGFVEDGGTAEQSGFMIGDKIIKVDGVSVVGESIDAIKNLIVGEIDTTVMITVLRGDEEIELVGKRVAVSQSTVSGGILEGNIGYINIISFGSYTASEFESISNQFKESGVEKLILDLRNNPGGFVDSATEIAKMIVPEGNIAEVSYRNESENTTYVSELEDPPFDIIVLVNGNTASSSEILASAIQDSGVGILLGEQTFGKAVVQRIYSVSNGSMIIKLTTGQYLTRNGNEINGVGLEPDEYVTNYTTQIDTSGYTAFDFKNKYAIGQNADSIKAAKERLKLLGYYSGDETDSIFDLELQQAIADFQNDAGLAPDGVLDIPTQVKLKEQFETLETIVDRQLQTAYEKFGGTVDELY